MKRNMLLLLLTVICGSLVQAQSFYSGSLELSNGTTMEGRLYLDQQNEAVRFKGGGDEDSFAFSSVRSVQIKKRTYTPLSAGSQTWMAASLDAGKATLYHLGGRNFLVSSPNGAQMVEAGNAGQGGGSQKIRGVLSVIYQDCNSIRETINNLIDFRESNLVNLNQAYNSCEYGDYAPTDREVQKAEKFNTDIFRFYLGAGIGLNSVKFFDTGSSESLVSPRLNAGVTVSPAFNNNLRGALFFYFNGAVNLPSENDFGNSPSPTTIKITSWQFDLGTEYLFNSKGKVKPLIGIGIGFAADRFKGNVAGEGFNIGGGNVFFTPRAGVQFALNNGGHLGLIANFIPRYDNDLTFPRNGQIIPLIVNSQWTNFTLVYYFK
ncbi:outer membrane beta-barrel protein [Aureitalea marina]|uniref:Outer membrane protein beta-barrel domain-containing protein n=1 Tax=Aureitalea marina TaxID=930804 RepID=A0A2S7KQX1_9FLAO|nr:outer membrane beta-barrel protein [Aureitalea marina]PQB05024.1 hypothetical protein BST85_09060 [Aureitalea marina]